MSRKPLKSMNDGTEYRFQPKGPEKKCKDAPLTDDSFPINGDPVDTANFKNILKGPDIAQGPALDERIGKRITIKKIHGRFQFDARRTGAGATTADAWLRLICVVDYQTNGSAIVATDLIREDNKNRFNVLGYRNMFASTRFRTLVDDFFPLTESFTADAPFAIREYNFKVNIPIHYSGATGNEAERTENSIRWILIGYSPAGVAGGDTLTITTDCMTRYRYTDN